MATTGSLYLGTSGLVLSYKNKMDYPPELREQSRITVYGRLFNSIEVNSIFYKLPRPATVAGWAQSVGADFRFTFKLWKQLTHRPGLGFDPADLQRYIEVITGADKKKGCILIQFPASVKPPLFKNVKQLLAALQAGRARHWPLAVEFRSPLWYTAPVYELLNARGIAMVYHDKAGSGTPRPDLAAQHIYLRFHGPEGDYKGSYDRGFLYQYAGHICDWLKNGKTVYAYFNNTLGAALENLRTLEQMVRERCPAS